MQKSNIKRCLVVDDYPDIRAALRKMLERLDFEVVEARDGREALEIYEKATREGEDFNLAIIDHLMPHYKGDVVMEGIRRLAETYHRKPPVMAMLTGSKDGELIARTQAVGLGKLFLKPNGITDLQDWLTGKPAII
jgi:CheY-like chemotaxis protein